MQSGQHIASSVRPTRNQVVAVAVEVLEGRRFLSAAALTGSNAAAALSPIVPADAPALSLAFGKSTVPSSVVTGGGVRGALTLIITNHASAKFRAATPISLYASTNGLIDGSSVLIETINHTTPIIAGKSASVRAAIKSLPSTLNGTYTLVASLSDPTTSSTVQAAGPALAVAPAAINFSEVLVSSTLPTGTGRGKDAGNAILKITSHGNITSKGKTTIQLYVSPNNTVENGTLIQTRAVVLALKPGMSKTLTIPITSAPSQISGSDTVVAVVTDPLGHSSTTGVTVTNPAIKNYSIFRTGQYVQTSTAAPTQLTGFFFSDRIFLNHAGDYDNAVLAYPGSSQTTPLLLANSTLFQVQTTFLPSQAAIDAAYPPGNYTTTVSNGTTGALQVLTLNDAGNAYPGAAPAFTADTFTAMQSVNSASAFTFNYNAFVTGSVATQSFVFLTITDASNQTVYSKSFANDGTTSITLPAGTLSAHTSYTVMLNFSNRVVSSTGSTPTNEGFELKTGANLTTT